MGIMDSIRGALGRRIMRENTENSSTRKSLEAEIGKSIVLVKDQVFNLSSIGENSESSMVRQARVLYDTYNEYLEEGNFTKALIGLNVLKNHLERYGLDESILDRENFSIIKDSKNILFALYEQLGMSDPRINENVFERINKFFSDFGVQGDETQTDIFFAINYIYGYIVNGSNEYYGEIENIVSEFGEKGKKGNKRNLHITKMSYLLDYLIFRIETENKYGNDKQISKIFIDRCLNIVRLIQKNTHELDPRTAKIIEDNFFNNNGYNPYSNLRH